MRNFVQQAAPLKVKTALKAGGQVRYEMTNGAVYHVAPQGWILSNDLKPIGHPLVDELIVAFLAHEQFKPLMAAASSKLSR